MGSKIILKFVLVYWCARPGPIWSQGWFWPASVWAGSVGCVNVIFTGAGMCLLVNEARPKACASFLVKWADACQLLGGAGSWPSGGQGHV